MTPLLGINPKELQVGIQSDMHTPILKEALFATVKRWKQLIYATTDEQVNKMWYIHTT